MDLALDKKSKTKSFGFLRIRKLNVSLHPQLIIAEPVVYNIRNEGFKNHVYRKKSWEFDR